MPLLLSAASDPSGAAVAVPWLTLFRLKGFVVTEQPDGAGPMLSKKVGRQPREASSNLSFPSILILKAVSWKYQTENYSR